MHLHHTSWPCEAENRQCPWSFPDDSGGQCSRSDVPGSVSQVDCTWGSAWLVLSFIHSENFMDLSFWFTGSYHGCRVESHYNIHKRSCCSNSPKVCPLAEKKTPSFHRGLPGLPDLGPHLFSELISTIPPSPADGQCQAWNPTELPQRTAVDSARGILPHWKYSMSSRAGSTSHLHR